MQLSRLYSNLDTVFTPIDFNCGRRANVVNVVFARVKQRKRREGDSHNLGKTTLIHLIDFMLLKDISSSGHFLAKHADRFAKFVFYMEIALGEGGFVTVRRAVEQPTKIALKRHVEEKRDCRNLDDTDWDHWDIPLGAARELLDSYFSLRTVEPWDYRTGVSYFLRTQEDYQDYFQIMKFVRGKHREWKPYLAAVLGLDHRAVHEKYLIDEAIDEEIKRKKQRESEIQLETHDRGEIASKIDIMRDETTTIADRLDGFDFSQEERRISKKMVDEVEARIQAIIDELYDLDADIAQMNRSINTGIKFDLAKIKEIFEECRITMPDALARSYDELVDFNRKLTRERNAALRARVKELAAQRESLISEHDRLNAERKRLHGIVREADTFKKFKALQKELAERRASLAYLEAQLSKIDAVATIERTIRDLKKRRDDQMTAIEVSLQRGSPVKTRVTTLFNRYVKQVLGVNGEFIVTMNTEGNIEFEIKTKDAVGNDTSQSEGHSYHRLLCALFDLAVLKALEDAPFYHFVYHDGIFEGLDNRVKLRLLELIRECISNSKVQYILSVIDSDLPRDPETDSRIEFSEEEIALALHDQGDDGRLFKMPAF